MAYQFNNSLVLEEGKELSYQSKDIVAKIKNVIVESDCVYIYRSHNHLDDRPSLVKWLDSINCDEVEEVNINLAFIKHIEKIYSSNGKIYRLKLDETNKPEFLNKFALSIRDVKNNPDFELDSDTMLVDDPIYDQYDYIFTSNNKVLLMTDSHTFQFLFDKEYACVKQRKY